MTSPIRDLYQAGIHLAQSSEAQLRLQAEIETESQSCPLKQSLVSILEQLTEADLGITPAFFAPGIITSVTVYNSQEFWLGFFCMAAGTRFPLHDHPRMLGLSRLLSGRIHYTGLNILQMAEDGGYIAEICAEYELVGCGTEMLTGNTRNIHEIAAVEDSILLDFFVPYYSAVRECKFFIETERRDAVALLKEAPQPAIPCRVKTYRGCQVR